MDTVTASAVNSTTTRPDAGSSTARPDATTGVETADPAAAAHVLATDLDAAHLRRAPQAVVAPATGVAEKGVVAGRGGGMGPAGRPRSSDRGAGGARGGSADMSRVRIRELGPADGDVVDVVFAGLSPRSRYLRFHGPVGELSAATRRSLTALDGRTHVALAAFAQGRPIGIVRVMELGDGCGELAVEVVDRWQGSGVGTQLLRAARDRAAELGYRELVGEMLAVNGAVHKALSRVFVITRVRRDGLELTVTMSVDGEPAPASPAEGLAA
jgi:GNAT superfamily N-acetyltransferase